MSRKNIDEAKEVTRTRHSSSQPDDDVCTGIAERLRARDTEMERIIFEQLQDVVPESNGNNDPEYEKGLREAVQAGVSYSLLAIEGRGQSESIPSALVLQARRAARSGVRIETMIRRVAVAERLVKKFATEEAHDLPARVLGQMLSSLGATIDSLIEVLADEYNHESERTASSFNQHRKEVVCRLLASEALEPAALAALGYNFHAPWHLGIIAAGTRANSMIDRLKARFGRGLLCVPQEDEIIWVWLAGSRKPMITDIERTLSPADHPGISLAVGEPGQGIDGWRQTHREAQAALVVAMCDPHRLTRYAECHFLAAARQIDTLGKSLTDKYIAPLRGERDGGTTLRKTLRAWVDAEGYASSAAESLKVDRHTVENHIRTTEKLLGLPLRRSCLTGLDVALRLEETQ